VSHPIHRLPAVIAARALNVSPEAVISVERIKHGLTNDSWRVRTRHDAVIVRLSSVSEELLQLDRASEARVLAIVAEAGIGPEVVLCDPEQRVLVTRELGTVWSEADAHVPRNIERLAGLLRKLHALQVPDGVRRVELLETLRGYLASLDEHGIVSSVTARERRERGEWLARALSEGSKMCLCHNDVHHLNVIDDGVLRLIDWEYSGIGVPLFDLASVSVYHGYDQSERERLLEAYLETSSGSALQQLEHACWLFEYIRELWHEVRDGPGTRGSGLEAGRSS